VSTPPPTLRDTQRTRAFAYVQRLVNQLIGHELLPVETRLELESDALVLSGEGLAAALQPLLQALFEAKLVERQLASETLHLYRESALVLKTALACAGSAEPSAIAESLVRGYADHEVAAVLNRHGTVLASVGTVPPALLSEPLLRRPSAIYNDAPGLEGRHALVQPLGTRDDFYLLLVQPPFKPFTSAELTLATTLGSIAAAALANAYQSAAQRTLSRYLPQAVVRKLLEEDEVRLGGVEQTATIMILDIRGFTPLSAELGAAETVTLLNRFFAVVAPLVRRYGIVDKYLGDGLLGVWGVPFADPQDADHAFEAAQAIVRGVKDFAPQLAIGIGLARGRVISGNIGIPERMDYTVIGSPVNEAAKLEEKTKVLGQSVLLSAALFAALSAENQGRCRVVEGMDFYTAE
jgi:class 3 adenylate cyclase